MGEVVVTSGEEMEVELGTEEEAEKKKTQNETVNEDASSEVVRWEKFLPRMVLRVLLVEADDSTRQIIAALLRKCSYRAVAAVPDGLMAWETLKGRPHSIDLILTEVELPSISGYALLTLVMEHDICKNIPVIMMSSHDSISMVLKCMLKGAADFLIKPVRRNELRNLWRHVWRRQNLTAGHIPQSSPDAQHKVEAASENNSASDHSSDCATSSHKRKECSEKGNDNQSSCTTPYSELRVFTCKYLQGISQPKLRSASNLSNMEEECAVLNKGPVIPENKTEDWSTRLGPMSASCNGAYNQTTLKLGEHASSAMEVIQAESLRPENERGNSNTTQGHNDDLVESSSGAIDLIGTFDNGPKHTYVDTNIKDGTNKFEFTPLELSLRRFFPNSSKNQGIEDRHALNHSNASAFSWYNNKILQPLFPTSTSNCIEFREDTSKSPEMSSNERSQKINGFSQQHGPNLNGGQEIMTTLVIGQSRQAELAYPNPIPIPGVRVDNISTGYGHVFPSLYGQKGVSPAWNPKLSSQRDQSPFATSTSIHSNPEIHDSEQNNRQSDDITINSVDQNLYKHDNMEQVEELRHSSPAAGQSTSSSMCNGIADHNKSSAYGSSCSRSDGNTTLAAAPEEVVKPESLKDGGIPFRSSQREAALTKFRLKRKDRCYEQKVRYQSRKRLAEQRPRVKGQFVRQVQNNAPAAGDNN
ncbi:two-component response regulator-like APRR3 isoform X3 [Jatropha curcas]|uniref:two-component response regulator-like APRR3 isoform X3 n=1 Tax=Jatropha curcas TaxID=180498 RepID=UPI00189524A2|nr:two-component response regulator-like APRR3 isoform X3 [Jatropha curcas]